MSHLRACVVTLAVAATAALSAGQVLERLGLTQEQADDAALTTMRAGYPPHLPVDRSALRALPAEQQASLVGAAGALLKTAWKARLRQRYLDSWSDLSGAKPPAQPRSYAEILKAARADTEHQIAEMRKVLSPEQMKEMEPALRAPVRLLETADPADVERVERDEYELLLQAYREAVANGTAAPPQDPETMLRQRLQWFLEATRGVDFNAALEARDGGVRVFADPAYESKPPIWKLSYRAGRAASEAARTFAAGWLKELGPA